MPQVLTLTRKPEESVEEFAARISGQMGTFFGGPTAGPATEPADVPTDVPPEEEDTTASLSELLAEFGRGPGWVTNPEGTRKLHAYWVKGEGAAKIRWGQEGDFARCERLVGEKIAENDPSKLRFIKNICAQWHKDATGATPGNAPGEGD